MLRSELATAFRRKVAGMTVDDYKAFCDRYSLTHTYLDNGTMSTQAERVQASVMENLRRADSDRGHMVRLCRALELPTPEEEAIRCARESARLSDSSRKASWVAAIAGSLALILSLVQFFGSSFERLTTWFRPK